MILQYLTLYKEVPASIRMPAVYSLFFHRIKFVEDQPLCNDANRYGHQNIYSRMLLDKGC